MFPNRQIIRTITNPFLRLAMYTATGEELAALQRTFPLCFSENPDDLCVPVSLVRQEAELHASDEGFDGDNLAYDREMAWWDAVLKLGIPIAFEWNCNPREYGGELFPSEVWEQIDGRLIPCGVTVVFHGETFVVVNSFNEEYPAIAAVKRENSPRITVVLARFIDLKA